MKIVEGLPEAVWSHFKKYNTAQVNRFDKVRYYLFSNRPSGSASWRIICDVDVPDNDSINAASNCSDLLRNSTHQQLDVFWVNALTSKIDFEYSFSLQNQKTTFERTRFLPPDQRSVDSLNALNRQVLHSVFEGSAVHKNLVIKVESFEVRYWHPAFKSPPWGRVSFGIKSLPPSVLSRSGWPRNEHTSVKAAGGLLCE